MNNKDLLGNETTTSSAGKESRTEYITKILTFFKGKVPAVIASIDLASLLAEASPEARQRGISFASLADHAIYRQIDEVEAIVSVADFVENLIQETTFTRFPDGSIFTSCSCEAEIGSVCEHVIASAISLREIAEAGPRHLAETPATTDWRTDLARLLRLKNPPARTERETRVLLIFALLPGFGGFDIHPWLVDAAAVPEEAWTDREKLEACLVEQKNRKSLREVMRQARSGDIWKARLANETPFSRVLMKAALDHLYQNMSSRRSTIEAHFWDGLASELVFEGEHGDPLKRRIEVISGVLPTRMEMEAVEGGLRLAPVAILPTGKISLLRESLKVCAEIPVWLLCQQRLFRSDLTIDRLRNLHGAREVLVPAAEVGEFYGSYLGEVVEALPITGNLSQFEDLPATPPVPRLYLMEKDEELRVCLRFGYGEHEVPGLWKVPTCSYFYAAKDGEAGDRVALRLQRQRETELEWHARLDNQETGLKAGKYKGQTRSDTYLLRRGVHPYDFLSSRLPRLIEAGFEIYGEAALSSRINKTKPRISFEISSEIDWFDLKTSIEWGNQKVPLKELRQALRRNEKFIKLADGTLGEIPDDWLEKYRHLFGLSEAHDDGYRVSRHHIALLDDLFRDDTMVKADQKFEVARDWLRNFDGIAAREIPASFQGELRPYQKAGFDWLHFLRESGFGGCLADDMGTGKTIQALTFLLSLRESWEARNRRKRRKEAPLVNLLVVPRSLVTNWIREAERFTPGLRVLDFAHSERATETAEFDQYDLVVTTYGILIREVERLRKYPFDTVILDEAQAIKNPVSESAKAARALTSRHRLTLTGTPVENNTLELWSQFAFLNPGLLGSAEYFREQFLGPIERRNDATSIETLKRLVYPFILRRTKEQVITDLPPRTEKIIWCEMEPAQRAIYDQTRDHFRTLLLKLIAEKGVNQARFRVLEGLLRLRQICNHPRLIRSQAGKASLARLASLASLGSTSESAKMEALLELLANATAEGHKILVFSQFVQMLRLIEKELKRTGIRYAYLDGATTNRQSRVDSFQQDDQIAVFLISLKAGGVGLNLTAADYVIHVDPWWNPAVEMQASDRAHRLGQEKPVFIYKLMVRDSVEEKILQLQERKRSLVTQLITTEAGFFKSLSAEDIGGLFS